MSDSSSSGLSRRSLVKALGVGAAAGLAGCGGTGGDGAADEMGGDTGDGSTTSGDGGSGDSGNAPLFWNYAFPNDGTEPIWKDTFLKNAEERIGQEPRMGRFAYEDLRQKFLTGARTGDPDVIEGVLSHLTEYVKADHLEPIGGFAEGLPWYDGYVQSALDALTYRGKLYGLPYNGNARAFIVRQDILDELGQDVPQSASAFHEVGRMINSEYDDIYAYHNCTKKGSVRAFQEWMSHVYQHTDQLYVPDGDSWKLNIKADQLGQIFDNWYYQIYAADDPVGDPDTLGTGWQVNDPGYLNGRWAFIECGTWLRGWTSGDNINNSEKTKDILNNKTLVGHLPRGEGASKGTFLEVKPVMVNTHSDQKEAAKGIAASFASPDTLTAMGEDAKGNGMTPVHKDVESTITNENWSPFTEVFKTGRALAKIGWGQVRSPFYTYMQQVAYGKTDPYKAGDQFHDELKSLASEL
ncbi:ABC transporter substrate-binding protein [Haloarcula sp. JP-L23]|uniref:ABC transporter substrate-binding protein n=1 Tax=Haloarcula sp. JP-L23 TaxID=2716717 RepID=UPI00140EFE92|nr:extracellular solute-binding protein [Haloarcula sp. JP-L23]